VENPDSIPRLLLYNQVSHLFSNKPPLLILLSTRESYLPGKLLPSYLGIVTSAFSMPARPLGKFKAEGRFKATAVNTPPPPVGEGDMKRVGEKIT
jgi:hypothetical protein